MFKHCFLYFLSMSCVIAALLLMVGSDKKVNITTYAIDYNRFIAHAGGQINGLNYTNSLESLELNYKNGFRKFELDIIKTSDGHFVAAHDWKMWSKMTGYTGSMPPSKATFMKTKIYDRYTPMDMSVINHWFNTHLDAVLVTDKVRNVAAFSKQFTDKNRLMMEVFKWKHLKVAQKLNLKSALPTGNLLKMYKGDVIQYLIKNDVKEVAVSRLFLESDRSLIQNLNKANIRIYAFHVDESKGIGTDHMICNEADYFYGFYANIWHDKWQPECKVDN